MERYRSGHNGAVLKTVRVFRLTRVRIPSSPPMEKYSSGWRGSPAKGVDPFKRDARVQIPPSPPNNIYAQIAQSVEQRTENPRVGGSIPPLGTIISLCGWWSTLHEMVVADDLKPVRLKEDSCSNTK